MIETVGQAVLSASVLVIAFAIIIVAVEEFRLWRGQREVDKVRAEVAHTAAVNAAKRRHPSAIMRDEMDADLAADIAAQKAKTRRAVDPWQP